LKEQNYCVKVCDMTCCDDGLRVGYEWVTVVKNTLHQYSSFQEASEDVSLVAQGSFDRLEVFNLVSERWRGPKV
jgi:hypothetical protein